MSTREKYLEIMLDGQCVLNYEKRRLPGQQRNALDQMDKDMHAGIRLHDQVITEPTLIQCAHYVVSRLLQAIESERSNKAALMCSWLATRMPDLQRIQIRTGHDQVDCVLIQASHQ